jgi:hypothetical protein
LPNPFHYYHTQVLSWPQTSFDYLLGRKGSQGFPEQQGMSRFEITYYDFSTLASGLGLFWFTTAQMFYP